VGGTIGVCGCDPGSDETGVGEGFGDGSSSGGMNVNFCGSGKIFISLP